MAATKWICLEAENFVVISDASIKDVTEFSTGYAAFRHGFETLFAREKAMPSKTQIFLLRREKDFTSRVTPPTERNTRRIIQTGDVDGSPLLVLPLAGDRETAMRFAYEFEALWGLGRLGYALPVWMSQGAGQVLSTVDTKKDGCVIGLETSRFANLPPSHELLPWERFFNVSTLSAEYKGPKSDGAFHAQAWAFAHWVLLREPATPDRFIKIAKLLSTTPGIEAVETVMGVQRKDFWADLHRHLRQSRTITIPFDEAEVRKSFVVRPATDLEVRIQFVNFACISGDYSLARQELAAAQALDGAAALTKEALARVALHDRETRAATDYYREAIAAGSKNPRAYFYSAFERLNESSAGSVDRAGGGARNVDEALVEIRKGLELDPSNQWGYQQLGRAFFLAQKVPETAIEELSRGIGPTADTAQILHYRALVYQRLGDIDRYVADLKKLLSFSDLNPAFEESLRQRLQALEMDGQLTEVEEAAREGKLDTALALLEKLESSTTNPRLTRRFNELRVQLEEQQRWEALRILLEAKKWQEFLDGGSKFLEDYPRSPQRRRLQTAMDRAKANLAK